jgi:hypothetical protein
MSRRAATVLLTVAAVLVACVLAAGPASAVTYAPVSRPGPALKVPKALLAASLTCSGAVDHATREPVLLLPGTATTPRTDFGWNYEPALTAAGIPWCAVTLPHSSLGDIQVAGEYVVNGIRRLHARSGRRIGIIGHSQGGMIGRWALRWWPDTRPMVADLIGNAPSNHGTIDAQAFGVECATVGCSAAILQQRDTAAFIKALNSRQETFAGIDYTVNYSAYDEIVVPNTGARLSGPGRIANTRIQDVCPGDLAEHLAIGTYDNTAWALALDALTHDGPADPARLNRAAVCADPFMPGVDRASFLADYGSAAAALGAAIAGEHGVRAEPALACYVTASCPRPARRPARRPRRAG